VLESRVKEQLEVEEILQDAKLALTLELEDKKAQLSVAVAKNADERVSAAVAVAVDSTDDATASATTGKTSTRRRSARTIPSMNQTMFFPLTWLNVAFHIKKWKDDAYSFSMRNSGDTYTRITNRRRLYTPQV